VTLIPLIPNYGRWDDLFSLLDTNKKIEEYVVQFIVLQLGKDAENMAQKKTISLLAKWMPSENATSAETIKLARKFITAMGIKASVYRKQLSAFRKYIDVTEVKTSANKWSEIDYQKVPSKANVKYNKAFYKHDLDRREAFIEKVNNGEAKINSSVNFPHDIVHMYDNLHSRITKVDPAVEALWKALPNYGIENTLVVADGSGSMTSTLGKTNVSALEVANALAIYCAEHNKGEYYNKYITFSETPQFVIFNDDMTLSQKLDEANRHSEVANTNIEAVFDLVLKTAVNKKIAQEEFPHNILIISDMEFDQATGSGWNEKSSDTKFKKLFEVIGTKYSAAGYKLPRLCFWNVNSRTNGIPVTENEAGISLVSGFSPAIIKMVMSDCLDPFEALLEVLNGERYSQITW
jgi:hypothetical protein